jgi:hypothetical protein
LHMIGVEFCTFYTAIARHLSKRIADIVGERFADSQQKVRKSIQPTVVFLAKC